MATKAAIVIQQHYAIERITGALNRLLDGYGVDPVELPRLGRYPELLHNQQLEAIATALEVLSPAPYVEPEPESMTLPDEDMPPLIDDEDAEITDFDINAEGVMFAETNDGSVVVSDGQEQPEEDEDAPGANDTPRKGKGRR